MHYAFAWAKLDFLVRGSKWERGRGQDIGARHHG